MILYLTQECKQTLKTLIRCDYLTENWHIHMVNDWYKQVQKQEDAIRAIEEEKASRERRRKPIAT